MAFIFPSSPSTGTQYVAPTGVMYVWDGSWTTKGDTQTPNPFINSFKYRTIYTKGYMSGGYAGGSPWINVNKTIHATDLTTNLGDLLGYGGGYIGGGFSDYNTYIYSASGGVGGSTNRVESMNMISETNRTLDTNWYLKTSRSDCECLLTPSLTIGYIVGGVTANVDKHNLSTEIMYVAGSCPISPLAGGTGGGLGAFYGEFKGWISQGAGSSLTFATETWTTAGMSWASDGQPKGLSSKHGFGYGSIGSYAGSANLYKFNESTGSNVATITRPKTEGEENWQMGQDWGYQIGAYDGASQNNDASKVNYLTDTCTAMGSDTQPKGHAGCSSGASGTGSASITEGLDVFSIWRLPSTYNIKGTLYYGGRVWGNLESVGGYKSVTLNRTFYSNFEVIAFFGHNYRGIGLIYGASVSHLDYNGYSIDGTGPYWGALNTSGYPDGYGGTFMGTYVYSSTTELRWYKWKRVSNTLSIQYSTTSADGSWTNLVTNATCSTSDKVVIGAGEAGDTTTYNLTLVSVIG